MNCKCKDWEDNIDKLNAPNTLSFARNPTSYRGYMGVIFKYCPWCSRELIDDDNANWAARGEV